MATPLSIVMPVYNESAVIGDVVGELLRDVVAVMPDAEIVLVDDGSTDGSGSLLDSLAASHPGVVRALHAEANQGHGPSLRMGFEACSGDWIFQMDSDGQQRAAEILDLWALRGRYELVVGVRRGRSEGRHRDLVSLLARLAGRIAGSGPLRDVNVPFKLIRRDLWEDLRPDVPDRPVAPSLLIAVGAGLRAWRVGELPVSHMPRRAGESTVDVPALVRLTWGAFRELIAFRVRVARRAPRVVAPEAAAATPVS